MAFLRTSQDAGLVINGRGIVLRPPSVFDYGAWADLRRSSEPHLHPWEPEWAADELTRFAYRRRLRQYTRDVANDAGYAFFICRHGDHVLLGGITLSNVRRGVSQAASVGYWVGARHAGQGVMSEALRTLLPFAFDYLRLHRLEAACLLHNAPSIRVLEKMGFQREGLARGYLKIHGHWQDHVLFALTENDQRGDAE